MGLYYNVTAERDLKSQKRVAKGKNVRFKRLGGTGLLTSEIGFGAWPLGDVFGRVEIDEVRRATQTAIEQGINLFDVSPYYGQRLAEERLGLALESHRQDIILATKCGRYGERVFDFSEETICRELEQSLRRLGTDYVDLLQAHDVEFADFEMILHETLPAMWKLQRAGKVRFTGVTGYPPELLAQIMREGDVDVVLSYCHYDLLMNDMDRELTPAAVKKEVGLINASPMHMGLLSGSASIPDWHPAPDNVKAAASEIVQFCRAEGLDPAVVALKFCLDHPYVSSTLVGMSSASEVLTNVSALDFSIDSHIEARIQVLVADAFNVNWPSPPMGSAVVQN